MLVSGVLAAAPVRGASPLAAGLVVGGIFSGPLLPQPATARMASKVAARSLAEGGYTVLYMVGIG
ncbi:MAG TPA: hypothetical protein PKA23_07120 [Accumulibacter sp.]|nr:hypothetical protein [Accumulibacter sp.]HMX68757.1 hypothetical protein [Accumulibacter sp.]HNC26335.1 hypothetical protein [Accumulibacter sp.]HNE39386.1 hypothetical protein [Accumulibacter sp.]HNG85945.1 hypothetical protein [Accumulibacter sp.]